MSDERERCVHGWVHPEEWCTSCMSARIAELEAQVRERDEALKVAENALREIAMSTAEARDMAEMAWSAYTQPLIGGAK